MRGVIASAVVLGLFTAPLFAASEKSAEPTASLDTAQIDKLTGLKGKLDEKEQVYKVSAPRSDLQVLSRTVRITPPMGLTSWAAFKQAGEQMMVMGDMFPSELPSHWLTYFAVADTDATVAQAKKLGAGVLAQPFDIPDVGRIATFTGPHGEAFAVIKNAPQAS